MNMSSLQRLSVIGNELSSLPIGLQRFTALEALLASRNKISILPDSITDIPLLRELWLDNNQISSIPNNFHRLTKLQVLKLEGNIDMVYPSAAIIAMGAKEVLRWSRNRVSRNRAEKVRNIVQSLGEVLQQIEHYKIGGDLHESVFRVLDDQTYQLLWDSLFSLLLPNLNQVWSNPDIFSGGINSFPYERREVEQAIFQFKDAAGSIVKKNSSAKFAKCSCAQPCILSDDGWMCTRPALILRMNMTYEENMIEKRRVQAFEKKLAIAAKAAEAIAKNYLKTDDGMMMVRDEAERRIASNREVSKQSTQSTSRSSFSSTISAITSSLRGSRESYKALRKRHEVDVRNEYIEQEVAKSTAKVVEEDEHVRRIMKKWIGNSVSDIFQGWRDLVQASKKHSRRKARDLLRHDRRTYENNIAAYKLKDLELTKYDEMYDQFRDLPIWLHRDTNEILYEQPSNTSSYPKMPNSLLDERGEPLTPRTIARLEASSSSSEDESYYTTSSSSQSGSDNSVQSEPAKEDTDKSSLKLDIVKLSGKDAELKYAKQRVLEKRKSRIVEVAAKVKGDTLVSDEIE